MTGEEIGIGEAWLTSEQAAELTGYSQSYMRKLALGGKVTALKAGRDWLLNRAALLEFTRKMEALGPAKHDPRGAGDRDVGKSEDKEEV